MATQFVRRGDGERLRQAGRPNQVLVAALPMVKAVMIQVRFEGLHETWQQVAVHFGLAMEGVEALAVVDVEEPIWSHRPETFQVEWTRVELVPSDKGLARAIDVKQRFSGDLA